MSISQEDFYDFYDNTTARHFMAVLVDQYGRKIADDVARKANDMRLGKWKPVAEPVWPDWG